MPLNVNMIQGGDYGGEEIGQDVVLKKYEDSKKTGSSGSGSGGSGGGGGGGGGGGSSTPAPALPTLSLLSSAGEQWYFDPANGKWYVRHTVLGGAVDLLFEADETQMDAIFGEGVRPEFTEVNSNDLIASEDVTFGGNVAEIEGEGDMAEEVDRVISLAIDQQSLPDWIKNDDKALGLLFVSITEERTDDWFYEQLSKLDSFKERYPGIDTLVDQGLSVLEAVQAFTQYETQLKTLHAAAGFDSQAISPAIVGGLLEGGYSVDQVAESYGIWKRMNDHAPALEAFNQVLIAAGQKPLQGDDMYEFLAGNAPMELYDLYEASSITEAAEAAGLGDVFGGSDALELAYETTENLTLNQAYSQFVDVAQQALRLRHQLNYEQYDLSIDDLIDLSFGRAPRSGKTAAEVGDVLARITNQAKGFLGDKITPYFGFSDTGKPQALSFGELNRESA